MRLSKSSHLLDHKLLQVPDDVVYLGYYKLSGQDGSNEGEAWTPLQRLISMAIIEQPGQQKTNLRDEAAFLGWGGVR
jgi:hypothetical protein